VPLQAGCGPITEGATLLIAVLTRGRHVRVNSTSWNGDMSRYDTYHHKRYQGKKINDLCICHLGSVSDDRQILRSESDLGNQLRRAITYPLKKQRALCQSWMVLILPKVLSYGEQCTGSKGREDMRAQ
jgi:hypothetical protein